jgi:hypothetical protein
LVGGGDDGGFAKTPLGEMLGWGGVRSWATWDVRPGRDKREKGAEPRERKRKGFSPFSFFLFLFLFSKSKFNSVLNFV